MGNVNTKSIGIIFGSGIGHEILGYIADNINKLCSNTNINIFDKEINSHSFKKLVEFTQDNFHKNNIIISGPISGEFIYKYRQIMGLFCKIVNIKKLNPKIEFSNEEDIDILLIRENNHGLFNGEYGITGKFNNKVVYQIIEYDTNSLFLILNKVKEIALNRKRNVVFFTKKHGLHEINNEVIRLSKMFIENNILFKAVNIDYGVSDLINNPQNYDVVFSFDFLGDIITDLLVNIFMGCREIGYSINMDKDDHQIYQAISGSAMNIAFKNIANPLGYLNIIDKLHDFYYFQKGDAFRENVLELNKSYMNIEMKTKEVINKAFDI